MSIARTTLAAAIRTRLFDVLTTSDVRGTATYRWTDSDIDTAISEAIRLCRPLGEDGSFTIDPIVDTINLFLGLNGQFGTREVLNVKQVFVVSAASDTTDTMRKPPQYISILPPALWTFHQGKTELTCIELVQPLSAGENLRVEGVLEYIPNATTITADPSLVEEYTLSLLFEHAMQKGALSVNQNDMTLMQSHRANAEARKAQLLGFESISSPDQINNAIATLAAHRKQQGGSARKR